METLTTVQLTIVPCGKVFSYPEEGSEVMVRFRGEGNRWSFATFRNGKFVLYSNNGKDYAVVGDLEWAYLPR